METVDEPSSGKTKCLCLRIMSSSLKAIGCIKLEGKLFVYLFICLFISRGKILGGNPFVEFHVCLEI